MITTILFIAFGVLLLCGVPITVSLGLSSVIAMVASSWLGQSTAGITFLVQGMFTAFDSFPIMAVPMFMLAGEIMNQGGASRRLITLASVMVGRFPGGLAYMAIVSCMGCKKVRVSKISSKSRSNSRNSKGRGNGYTYLSMMALSTL